MGGGYAALGHSFGAFLVLQHAVEHPGEPLGTIVSAGMAGDATPNIIETMVSCHEIAKKAATYHCPY